MKFRYSLCLVLFWVYHNGYSQYSFSHLNDSDHYNNILDTNNLSFSSIEYKFSSFKKNTLSIFHQQNLSKNNYILLEFYRGTFLGLYNNTSSKESEFKISSSNIIFDSLISLDLEYFFKKNTFSENGGFFNDSLFREFGSDNSLDYLFNIDEAKSSLIANEINIGFDYFLSRKSSLTFDFIYQGETINYKDLSINKDFYSRILIDSVLTDDSFTLNNISLPFSYGYKNKSFGLTYRVDNYFNNVNSRSINGINMFVKSDNISNKYNYYFEYNIIGFWKNNFVAKFDYSDSNFIMFEKFNIEFNIENKTPDINRQIFSSNHIEYDTNWNNVFSFNTFLFAKDRITKFNILIDYRLSNNELFFDSLWNLNQKIGLQSLLKLNLNRNFKVKNFENFFQISYNLTNKESIFLVPDIILNNRISFVNSLFSDKLKYRLSLNLKYFNEYFSYGYIPSIREFHIQKSNEIGNYPFLDFIIDINIQRFNLNFAINHFNSGFSGNFFYELVDYPSLPRHYTFGIKWNLIN